jgi:hypothetical protein
MPKRRPGIAPQFTEDVFIEALANLRADLQRMKQTGPSSLQADDYENSVDAAVWETIMHWPVVNEDHTTARARPAVPWDTSVFYHPGYTDPDTEEVTPEGWKALSSYSVYAHKIFSDKKTNKVESPARVFQIHPAHDGAKVRQIIGWNGIPAGTNTIMVVNMTRGINLLSSPLSFTDNGVGDINFGGDPANPNNKVYAYDKIWINTTAASGKGLGCYVDVA